MDAWKIRVEAFKHLKDVGQDSPQAIAALLSVPLRDVLGALHSSGDFKQVMGKENFDWTLCPFARVRDDREAWLAQDLAARKSNADYAKQCAATVARDRQRCTVSPIIVTALRQLGPSTVEQLAARLEWTVYRVRGALGRHRDLLSSKRADVEHGQRGGVAVIWSVKTAA